MTALATIGFTQSSAERFFARLEGAGVRRVLDVRLSATSQLAGFAKADDLAFFLRRIGGIAYEPLPLLMPSEPMFSAYRKRGGSFETLARDYLALLAERQVEQRLDPALFDGACLLCSEATPEHCHRRLAAEYLNARWGGRLRVAHL